MDSELDLKGEYKDPEESVDERWLMKCLKVYVCEDRSGGVLSLFSAGSNYGVCKT